MQYYRKVLVFSSHKWDMTKNESKDSGYSIIDVMEYIRLSMYKASLPIYKDKDDDNNDGEIQLEGKVIESLGEEETGFEQKR